MLSRKALETLQQLFAENSNLQLPVALATEVLEIRQWAKEQLSSVAAAAPVKE